MKSTQTRFHESDVSGTEPVCTGNYLAGYILLSRFCNHWAPSSVRVRAFKIRSDMGNTRRYSLSK